MVIRLGAACSARTVRVQISGLTPAFGMRYDYSWNHPGGDYLNVYELIRDK